MLYGIQASKDVKFSNIARTLKEDHPLIKTEDRLSRNLDDEDFTDSMNDEVGRLGASKITEEMVIPIDPGVLPKRWSFGEGCGMAVRMRLVRGIVCAKL